MDIPCENCLILGRCKAIVREARIKGGSTVAPFMKCSLTHDYILQDGLVKYSKISQNRVDELKKYLGYYDELNKDSV